MSIAREQLEEQAAQWVSREDRGLSADESAMLAQWLAFSTENRVAYLRLRASWQRSEKLAALQGIAAADMPWYRRRIAAIAASILVLVVAATIGLLLYTRTTPTIYTTKNGERPTLQLADGTRVQLNSDTQMQASVTRQARTVRLDKGEAYFEVVHDASRPFVVYAGNRRITDLGTKFSVSRNGDDVRVIVTEGEVKVEVLGDPKFATPLIASRGNVVVSKSDQTLVASRSMKELEADLSWRFGMLTFDQDTLSAAAEQFNRYNHRHIVVQGAARDIRIGGSFRTDNIDAFASLVRNALGLKVTQQGEQIIISD